MVGCSGVVGSPDHPIDGMTTTLTWTGDEHSFEYADPSFQLFGCTHDARDANQPARTATGDALVWVWGNVLGFEGEDGYQPRDSEAEPSAADYCARLYDEFGPAFASGVNGDFVGIVYDRDRSTVSVFTDRLASWKLFYTELPDGSIAFASHVQALDGYPPVSLAFDDAYVVQHLSLAGPFGVKTPLRGVEIFPPGAVTTYDLERGSLSVEEYWRPRFEASDRPYSWFVDAFVDRFQRSIRDRTRDASLRYGVLMSGGSDARLILAALPDDLDVTAFHMAEWMNKEARTAERAAMAADVDFRFLRRGPEYFEELLERSPRMWNFDQLFNKAWAEGFMDEIRSSVDVVLTGHFCDTMFKDWQVPTRDVRLGPLGRVDLPFERPISSLEEVVESLVRPYPAFLETDRSLLEALQEDVHRTDEGIAWFGLEFDSLSDFVLGMFHYPATTDSFFRQSLRENLRLQMPVFDNRLLDLWVAMPPRYRIRHNVINDAVAATDPELAAIPHAHSGVSLGRSALTHRIGYYPMNALRRLSPFDAIPQDHLGHAPWGPDASLIRHRPFLEVALAESETLIRSSPFLDWDDVQAYYREHLDGEDHASELYRLVTFLKAPITERVAAPTDTPSQAGEEEPDPTSAGE